MERKRLYRLILLLSLAGYLWIGWCTASAPLHGSAPAVCLFREVTHLPCPACGTTRSLILLMNGAFRKSFVMNPFGAPLAAGLVIIPLWIISDILRKRESFLRWYASAECFLAERRWISIPLIALVVINWVWNITKGI